MKHSNNAVDFSVILFKKTKEKQKPQPALQAYMSRSALK